MDNIKQENIREICFNISKDIILPKFKNLKDNDINYKNGKEEGPYINFYNNGYLQNKGSYINGKRDGLWEIYWNNGQLFKKGVFKNGKRNGRSLIVLRLKLIITSLNIMY